MTTKKAGAGAPGREMTGAEMVIEALADQGVEHIFGYPGGAVLPIYDALFQQSNRLQHVLVRHEQGAVHAAEGYARSTGKVGCVLVTSGPGATNAVTGLTDALCDSIPIVCITGQVPTHLIGNDAFQECDTVGITRPCTKHNYLVKNIADLPRVLHEAFHIAKSGRPGPVVVDIPKDIQFAKGIYSRPEGERAQGLQAEAQGRPRPHQGRGRDDAARQAAAVLHRRRHHQFRPGGEQAAARARQAHRLPDHLDADGARRLSGVRSAVARHARHARHLGSQLGDARLRLMICIGARFDDRITGRLDAFAPHSRKIHVDIDPSSINKNVKVDLPIIGDCAHVLEDMVAAVARGVGEARQEGARRLVEADRQVARAQVARLQELEATSSSRNMRSSGSMS